MTGSSDTDYKAIFSHPEMVIDVLTGFIPGSWLEELDFATLEPCKSSFITDHQVIGERHSDLDRVLKWQNAGKQQSLSTAIARLAHRVLHKRMPNMPMPEGINDLKGVVSMLSENIENMVLESSLKAKQEGKLEGMLEGKLEGKLEGEATMFKAMLASRFGPAPVWVVARIDAASSEQLLAWGTRLFTANDLDDLFHPV
ncbi:MAG: hypothetical protein RL748_420 [Pseudomonadota bacterium]|jgi:hypothetical protein